MLHAYCVLWASYNVALEGMRPAGLCTEGPAFKVIKRLL